MLKIIDDFLNRTTMYRVVLYCLIALWVVALAFSFLGLLPYSPLSMLLSLAVITSICLVINEIFARVFEAPTNAESIYITAFILFFLITPPQLADFSKFLLFAGWVAVWSMASKYILAIRKKHIFNPAALAVALTAFTIGESASWWIGTAYMMPFILILGLLVIRKIRRADLMWGFLVVALATIIGFGLLRGTNPFVSLSKALLDTPVLFFAFIMLSEPLTTPPTRALRILYGVLVGFLFAPAVHIGGIYSTPELALLVGNIFSFWVSPKEKLILKLKQISKVAADTYDFIFSTNQRFSYQPGEYMEWTLAQLNPDSRGNRRYFTLASSPTEEDVRLGVKFYANSSSFKKQLAGMKPGDTIVASARAGDFVLPKNRMQKSVFIAGGIGVTPFRSMIKYLLDKNERRLITFLYSNKTVADIAYKDIFDKAEAQLGIKTVYTVTDASGTPDWQGRKGMIDAKMIMEEVPDYKRRVFYISGPHGMVAAFEDMLKKLGVKKSNIVTDFFPGFN